MNLITYSSRVSNFIDVADVSGNIKNNKLHLQYLNMIDNACKKAGITTGAVYPFVGGIEESMRFNFLNSAQFKIEYLGGGWIFSSTGAKPNGTTSYANTNLVPSDTLLLNDTHLSCYLRTQITGNFCEIGTTTNGTTGYLALFASSNNNMTSDIYNYTTGRLQGSSANTTGMFLSSRTSSNEHKIYARGSLLNTSNSSGGTIPDNFMYLACRFSNPVKEFYSPREMSFVSIGNGIVESRAKAFSHDIYIAQRSLGRT